MSDDPEKLYHYTTQSGAEGIKNSGQINPSVRSRGDAAYGDGVYLTSVKPSEAARVIERNNYDGVKVPSDRVSHVVEVPRSSLANVERVKTADGRDIYKVPTNEPLKLPDNAKIYKRDN